MFAPSRRLVVNAMTTARCVLHGRQRVQFKQEGIVDSEQKRRLAEEVVDLTVMNRFRSFSAGSTGRSADGDMQARVRMRQQQTELYKKHFEVEQLTAILDFYRTELGESILTSHERLVDDMASGFRLVTEEVKPGPIHWSSSPPPEWDKS